MKAVITGCYLAIFLTACTAEQDPNSQKITDGGRSNLPGIASIEDFAIQALSGASSLMYAYDLNSLQFPDFACDTHLNNYLGDGMVGEVSLQLQCVLDHEFWGLEYDISYGANVDTNWSVDESGNGVYSLAGTYYFKELSENGITLNALSYSNLDMVRQVSNALATDEFYFNLSQTTQQFGTSTQIYRSIIPFTYDLDEDRYMSGAISVTSQHGVEKSYQLNADLVLEQM